MTALLFLVARVVQLGSIEGMLSVPLVVAGGLVGVVLRAPAMVLTFWSIRLVGAQNYMASIALLPVTGMLFEQTAVAAGLMVVSRFHWWTLMLAIWLQVGTALILLARSKSVNSNETGI